MSETKEDTDTNLLRPLGCEKCNLITRHIVVENGFDTCTGRHEVHTVCQKCQYATDRYLEPRDFNHLLEGDYYA